MKPNLPSDRKSYTGINSATGVIIEKLIEKELLNSYQRYLINVHTLVRNLIAMMDGKTGDKIRYLKLDNNLIDFTKYLVEEMKLIIENFNNSDTEIVFYIPNYKQVSSKLGNRFKTINDFKSLKYYTLITQEVVSKAILEYQDLPVIKTGFKLPKFDDDYSKTLITTHNGIDLLNYVYNTRVDLIESFTGEFKKYNKWYTKYKKLGKKDMSILPFNEFIYYIFGDDYFVKPMNIPIREKIYDIALKKHWNYRTKIEKIKRDILHTDLDFYTKLKREIPYVYRSIR